MQARKRGVDLRLLSPGMARRQANSTTILRHRQLLAWHVMWRFAGTTCPCLTDRYQLGFLNQPGCLHMLMLMAPRSLPGH